MPMLDGTWSGIGMRGLRRSSARTSCAGGGARSCGMIGGNGINDESRGTSPAPDMRIYLTKDI